MHDEPAIHLSAIWSRRLHSVRCARASIPYKYAHLPAALDYAGLAARPGYAAYLVDAVQRTIWSLCRLNKSGLRYPMQWNIQVNGRLDRTRTL